VRSVVDGGGGGSAVCLFKWFCPARRAPMGGPERGRESGGPAAPVDRICLLQRTKSCANLTTCTREKKDRQGLKGREEISVGIHQSRRCRGSQPTSGNQGKGGDRRGDALYFILFNSSQ
jgi:hypothetical protein